MTCDQSSFVMTVKTLSSAQRMFPKLVTPPSGLPVLATQV